MVVKKVDEAGFVPQYIYSLSCPISGEVKYIGKSKNPNKRLLDHIRKCRNTTSHKNSWIIGLTTKGVNPVMHVIEETNIDEVNFWEMHYISLYKSWGFSLTNMTYGGDGGKNLTIEVRDRISKSLIGRVQSKEEREKRKISVTKAWESETLRQAQSIITKNNILAGKIPSRTGCVSPNKGKPFRGDKVKLSNSLRKRRQRPDVNRYDVLVLYKSGMSQIDIANKLCCNRKTIAYRIKELQYIKPTKKSYITHDALYEQYIIHNKQRKDVAVYFNCSEALIEQQLRKYNIRKR